MRLKKLNFVQYFYSLHLLSCCFLMYLDVSWCVPMRWWEEMTTAGALTWIKKTLLQEPSQILRTSVPLVKSPALHLKSPLLYTMTTLKKNLTNYFSKSLIYSPHLNVVWLPIWLWSNVKSSGRVALAFDTPHINVWVLSTEPKFLCH